MLLKKVILLFLLSIGFLGLPMFGYSQTLGFPEDSLWTYRVKLLQQFINRFNHREDAQGRPIASTDDLSARQRAVASLFEAGMVDTAPRNHLLSFVDDVTQGFRPHYLSFYDQAWYAQVVCQANYQGREQDVFLTFKVQQNPDASVQWVVVGAYANFLRLKENETPLILGGNAHELNFMRLFIGLKDQYRARDFVASNFQPDYLSTVLFLIQRGDLRLHHAKSIRYHFLQIPGWLFSVRELDRPTPNSGWLIYDLQAVNQQDKAQFITDQLHVSDLQVNH